MENNRLKLYFPQVLTHFRRDPKTGSSDCQTKPGLGLFGIIFFVRLVNRYSSRDLWKTGIHDNTHVLTKPVSRTGKNPGWKMSDSPGTEGEGDMRTRVSFLVTVVPDSPTVAISVAV